MSDGNNNLTKDQHYVPQFILRRFGKQIGTTKKGKPDIRLRVFDKQKNKWVKNGEYIVKPKKICYEGWLNEINGVRINFFEDFYAEMETLVSRVDLETATPDNPFSNGIVGLLSLVHPI